jgi:predicted TIM-barrel fold metal-dependent hydrolase
MRDDIFIFDNVVHMYDNRADNVIDPTAMHYMNRSFSSSGEAVDPTLYEGRYTQVDRALHLLFEDAEVDMAMAQTVPLFSYWREGFAPAERQHDLAAAAPDQVMFCGGVDPVFQGLRGAMAELERQATEWNATSFKFYQGHHAGLTWRADDRRLAYPLYEKMQELGITVAQFHKGLPLGLEYVEDLRPNDVQQAAVDFPEMTFVLHHFGTPFIDETINIASRFRNVWISLSAIINMYPVAPWTVYECLGKAMMNVGSSRILWGSEAFAYPRVQPVVKAFAELQMPVELQERYGYPDPSADAKRKMLGLNMARLMGVDVEAKVRSLYPDLDDDVVERAAGKERAGV